MSRSTANALREWVPRNEQSAKRKPRVSLKKIEKTKSGRRSFSKLLFVCVVGLLALGLMAQLVGYGLAQYEKIFTVKSVKFNEEVRAPLAKEVERVLTPYVKGHLFEIDLATARQALVTLPAIREAFVMREWPNTIVVSIIEQKAIARWNDTAFVNGNAEVFAGDERIFGADDLPRLYGNNEDAENVLSQYQVFSRIVLNAGIWIESLTLDQRHSWTLKGSDGVTIDIGKNNSHVYLSRYMEIYRKQLFKDKNEIAHVDLRHENGIAVRWKQNNRLIKKSQASEGNPHV